MTTPASKISLIDYPCEFPLKIMGKNCTDFVPAIIAIIKAHDPLFKDSQLAQRTSTNGTYLGLTAIVLAISREQLDALYSELSAHPFVRAVF